MRIIKFRGKEIKTGEWIYGDLFQRIGYYPEIITTYPDDNGKIAYKGITVKPDSVGQYTEYNDVDKNEIYDGDIIESKKHVRHLIVYDEKEKLYVIKYLPLKKESISSPFTQEWIDMYKKKIIGNKYDNPELLNNND